MHNTSIAKVTKLGILLNNFCHNQLAYQTLKSVANYYNHNGTADITLFQEVPIIPIIQPHTAIMFPNEVYEFDGTLVITNLNHIPVAEKAIGPTKKIFYVWDLEWIYMQQKQYEHLAPLYRNKNFTIVARSLEHARLLRNAWNIEVNHIIQQPKIEDFLNVT